MMEPPILNVPSDLTFILQAGLLKDTVTISITDFTIEKLKELACNFLDRKVSLYFEVNVIWYLHATLGALF